MMAQVKHIGRAFRFMSTTTDGHFGLGIVLDQYMAEFFSLNLHLGPLVVKAQYTPDWPSAMKRILRAQDQEIAWRDMAIARLRERGIDPGY